MTFIDQSLDLVRRAAKRLGKKPLAARAGVSDASLRTVESPGFSPTARTLRKLETEAARAESEGALDDPRKPIEAAQ